MFVLLLLVKMNINQLETSIFSSVLGMIGQYAGIALLFLLPTIYCYVAFNIHKFRNLNNIIKRIITLCVYSCFNLWNCKFI